MVFLGETTTKTSLTLVYSRSISFLFFADLTRPPLSLISFFFWPNHDHYAFLSIISFSLCLLSLTTLSDLSHNRGSLSSPVTFLQLYVLPHDDGARGQLEEQRTKMVRSQGLSVLTFPIVQSSCLQHKFKVWQELRNNRLTASTFAGAIGFWHRRRAQLWLEKIGAIEPFTGNLATVWNNIKEEEALERYKLITGNPVSFLSFQFYGKKNPQEDWLGCSPDGVVDRVVYGLSTHGVLEIKCPFFHGDKTKTYPWKRIPLYCIPQAQGLMEILDRDWMDLYCWTVNGSSLFRIFRDREYWELLNIALSDFWWKHVQPAREMYSNYVITDPLFELKSFRPSPRHELCPDIVRASKYIVDDSKLLMREIHGKLQTRGSWEFT